MKVKHCHVKSVCPSYIRTQMMMYGTCIIHIKFSFNNLSRNGMELFPSVSSISDLVVSVWLPQYHVMSLIIQREPLRIPIWLCTIDSKVATQLGATLEKHMETSDFHCLCVWIISSAQDYSTETLLDRFQYFRLLLSKIAMPDEGGILHYWAHAHMRYTETRVRMHKKVRPGLKLNLV